ncbi:MAG: gp436 family protein [Alphaproteobacteria bacterium]
MSYAAQSDLVTRFGQAELLQLADDGEGAIDATRVAAALTAADNLIDAYIGGRYDLPLATVPPVLVDKACDIARYELMGQGATEAAQIRYDAAIALLRDIAAGRAALPLDDGDDAPALDGQVETVGPARVFGRDRMSGF